MCWTHVNRLMSEVTSIVCRLASVTQHSVLGQGAVAHGVRSLAGRDVVHGDADPLVDVLVVKHVVPVAARSK